MVAFEIFFIIFSSLSGSVSIICITILSYVSDILAEEVFKALDAKLGNSTKKRTDNTDGDSDKEAGLYVLTATTCPSILCELGFMTNRKECELMQTAKWKEDCAQAIFEGIINYSNKTL